MIVTIDNAGRLVIPKGIREALGLRPKALLKAEVIDSRLVISSQPSELRLVKRGKMNVAKPKKKLPVLSTSLVRETLEHTRR